MMPDKVAILTKKTVLEFERLSNPVLQEYGLTGAQYRILKYLFAHEDEMVRQVDLERYYSLTHPTAIGLLQQLERKGFIRRQVNPNDSRSRVISLTEQASERRADLEHAGTELEERLTRALSEDERRQLIELLQKLLSAF